MTRLNALAIDVGGTKIAMSVVDEHGETTLPTAFATPHVGTSDDFVEAVASHASQYADGIGIEGRLVGVSITTTGPSVERDGQLFFLPPNIATLRDEGGVPYPDMIAKALGLPVIFENDGNALTAAEVLDPHGAAYRESHVIGVTWSSGVGCGLWLDDGIVHFEPIDGATGEPPAEATRGEVNSPEFGHWMVNPGPDALECGDVLPNGEVARGHLESEIGGGSWGRRGVDPKAIDDELMARGLRYLPVVIAPFAVHYDVHVIVIAGSIGQALLDYESYESRLEGAFSDHGIDVDIRKAAFENASLRGAEVLAHEAMRRGGFN